MPKHETYELNAYDLAELKLLLDRHGRQNWAISPATTLDHDIEIVTGNGIVVITLCRNQDKWTPIIGLPKRDWHWFADLPQEPEFARLPHGANRYHDTPAAALAQALALRPPPSERRKRNNR